MVCLLICVVSFTATCIEGGPMRNGMRFSSFAAAGLALVFLACGVAQAAEQSAPAAGSKLIQRKVKIVHSGTKVPTLPPAGAARIQIYSNFLSEEEDIDNNTRAVLYFCPNAETREADIHRCYAVPLGGIGLGAPYKGEPFETGQHTYDNIYCAFDKDAQGNWIPCSFKNYPYLRFSISGNKHVVLDSLKVTAIDKGVETILYQSGCLRKQLKNSFVDLKYGEVIPDGAECPGGKPARAFPPVVPVRKLPLFHRGFIEIEGAVGPGTSSQTTSLRFQFCNEDRTQCSVYYDFPDYDPANPVKKNLFVLCKLGDGTMCNFPDLPYVHMEGGGPAPEGGGNRPINVTGIRIRGINAEGKEEVIYWNPCLIQRLAGSSIDLKPDDVAVCVDIESGPAQGSTSFGAEVDRVLLLPDEPVEGVNNQAIGLNGFNSPSVPFNKAVRLGSFSNTPLEEPILYWVLHMWRPVQIQFKSLDLYIYFPGKKSEKYYYQTKADDAMMKQWVGPNALIPAGGCDWRPKGVQDQGGQCVPPTGAFKLERKSGFPF
jgi:hypothetical protein